MYQSLKRNCPKATAEDSITKTGSDKKGYRTSHAEFGSSKGALGEGTYYFEDKANAIDRQAGTTKGLFETSIDTSKLATLDDISKLLGRKAKYADARNPKVITKLKEAGYLGVKDSGEFVIYNPTVKATAKKGLP